MIVDCTVYKDGFRVDGSFAVEEAFKATAADGTFVWVDLLQPTEEEFESVRREFDLHELAVEDAIEAHQRPKLEVYGDWLFMVLRSAHYDESSRIIQFGEIHLFIGKRFLITVRHGDEFMLKDLHASLESRPEILRSGSGAALHAVADWVVDGYLPVIEALDANIRDVEGEVFSGSRSNPAERIYKLKREVLTIHEGMSSLPEELDRLASGHHEVIEQSMLPYFRDVYDHLLRLLTQVEGFRELLNGILTANLTQLTVRQNEDMRRISAWAAMIAVPTLIAGIYGMNFDHMPELSWTWAYPLVLVVIASLCAVLYGYFRRIGWL